MRFQNRLHELILICLLVFTAVTASAAERFVAVTFDDLPLMGGDSGADPRAMTQRMAGVNRRLIDILTRQRIQAIGFVNESKLYARGEVDARIDLLRAWLDAGLDLGNHTFSHIAIDSNSLEAYREDLIRGETVTRLLLAEKGRKLLYFRHTQLRTGPTEQYRLGLAKFLEERGYRVAPVTIDNQEWIFAGVYARAVAAGDTAMMKSVGTEYVRYMEEVFDFFEKLSAETFGREIRQTLLLHANELNADYFDELAEMMKRRGYKFVTLEEAMKDEAYRLPDVQSNRGLSWLHRWRIGKGLPAKEEPAEPKPIADLFRTYRPAARQQRRN